MLQNKYAGLVVVLQLTLYISSVSRQYRQNAYLLQEVT